MAIRTREEIMTAVQNSLGDSATTDSGIELIEDLTDTLTDLEARASDQTDWEAKYTKLDADWRQRYTARFFSGEDPEPEPESEPGETVILSFDELFKEG